MLFRELVDPVFRALISYGQPVSLIPLEQSSRDTDTQDIEVTVNPDANFWSSTGSDDADADEHLLYHIEASNFLLSKITISFYQALYQPGKPCYASQRVRVSVGNKSDSFHYVSEDFTVGNIPQAQTLQISPALVSGIFIRIDLLGKRQQQPGDDRFYSCVRWVCAFGVPPHPLHVSLLFPIITDYLVETVCSGALESSPQEMIDFDDGYRFISTIYVKISERSSDEIYDLMEYEHDTTFPWLFRTNEYYIRLIALVPFDEIYIHLRNLSAPLTPLESILLLEFSSHYTDHYNDIVPCEETGDWFMRKGELSLAREFYRRCHYHVGMVTSTLRMVLETPRFHDMLEATLEQFTPIERAHILSEAIDFYQNREETTTQLKSMLNQLNSQGLISADCLSTCLSGPMALPSGLRLVEFIKETRDYQDYLFIC